MIIENFDDFYDHYQGFSAYVAFCITEDYELSKDISQEVFLALFKVKEKLVLNRLRKRNPMNYDILVKTKFQELSAAEVASEYGITPNNVNNRNLRSKAWIIEEMEKICRQSHR